VARLSIDELGICRGIILDTGEVITSDVAILAMGLGNKFALACHGFVLPMWNVWGAAVKAQLKEKTDEAPRGGVSFHTQRCFTGVPGGSSVIIAGTSMVIPAKEVPSPALYEEKLHKSLNAIFQGRIDETSLAFRVAPRPGIADDLPVIDLETEVQGLIVLNPTSHLGNTQSIGLGKLASLHILKELGSLSEFPPSLDLHEYRLDRFQNDIEQVKNSPRLLE
jgi:glycine/D-amino acid oxidase-like deaminating enzyme